MNRAKYIVAATLLLVSVSALRAQKPAGSHSLTVSWGAAMPTGNDGFLNKTALVVPGVSWEYNFSRVVSAGASLGWLRGSEKKKITTDRISTGGDAPDVVTGRSWRTLSLVPLQIHARYFPLGKKQSRFQPYLTIAAGAQYGRFHISGDQINPASKDNFAAVFTPDAGVRFFPHANGGLYLDARCYWQYGANSWSYTNTGSQQYLGFGIGAGFSIF